MVIFFFLKISHIVVVEKKENAKYEVSETSPSVPKAK